MRTRIALIFSFLFFITGTRAADTDKSLLWKISGKDLNKPSYLFGTIHLICTEDYIWTEKMQQSFNKADEVCFELDLDDPSVMMTIATGMIEPSGKLLKEYFNPEQYAALSAYIRDSLGMSVDMFSNMKPAILPMLFMGKARYCESSVSYEDKISEIARKAQKEIVGIEKPEEQIKLFNSLPTDSMVIEIMELIKGTGQEDSTYYQLINAYKTQDLPALYELLKTSDNMGADMNAFVDDRNIKWIPRMIDMMDQKSMFFAVGAGHLGGENGLINLLRKEGYKVEAVK
jgi:uncharacterized protein YbaP (TraB family)